MLLDPNIRSKEIKNQEIIQEFLNPSKYKRRSLYGIMSKRASRNKRIKELLFSVVISEESRNEIEMGLIKHSWLPTILILNYGSKSIKEELKNLINENWSSFEINEFIEYIKKDKELYTYFTSK